MGLDVNGDDLKYFNIFWHGHKMPLRIRNRGKQWED